MLNDIKLDFFRVYLANRTWQCTNVDWIVTPNDKWRPNLTDLNCFHPRCEFLQTTIFSNGQCRVFLHNNRLTNFTDVAKHNVLETTTKYLKFNKFHITCSMWIFLQFEKNNMSRFIRELMVWERCGHYLAISDVKLCSGQIL